jgi:hypothetical protein
MKLKCRSMMGLASTVLLLVGCVVEPDEDSIAQPALTMNRLSMNGISANRLVATQIAGTPLLSAGQTNSQVTSMLATPEGREYFTYIVSCALSDSQSVVADGATYRGSIGLAPGWVNSGMTTSDKRWVSACLLARVNAYGVSVEISMQGANPALAASTAERATHPLAEGAFYGNLFVGEGQKMEMVACRGAAQASGETGDLVNRDCAEPGSNGLTQCGFQYAGDCLDFSPATPSAYACAYSIGGSYQECHLTRGTGIWAPGSERAEVITTYVRD